VRDDLKLLVFNVHSPQKSKKKFETNKSSSASSSSDEEDSKKNEEEEKKGKFNRNYKSILLPNLRYWQSEESGGFELLFESASRFNVSHIIVKTPRFTKYPLRRVLFFAFEADPRIKKPKKEDGWESGDENQGLVTKKNRVIWPPKVPAGKPVPFAYIEIPADKYYVEQKLSQNVQGRFIKALFLDGWEKEQGSGPGPLKSLGRGGHEKISIEFIGFVGPAEPGEIVRDVGAKFGIIH